MRATEPSKNLGMKADTPIIPVLGRRRQARLRLADQTAHPQKVPGPRESLIGKASRLAPEE